MLPEVDACCRTQLSCLVAGVPCRTHVWVQVVQQTPGDNTAAVMTGPYMGRWWNDSDHFDSCMYLLCNHLSDACLHAWVLQNHFQHARAAEGRWHGLQRKPEEVRLRAG